MGHSGVPEGHTGDELMFTTDNGDWRIYKNTVPTEALTSSGYAHVQLSLVYAYHAECKSLKLKGSTTVNCWYIEDSVQQCIICKNAVPDEVQTLMYLYVPF